MTKEIEAHPTNVNMMLILATAKRAIVELNEKGLVVRAISVERIHPILHIETPSQDHEIRRAAQSFGTLERVEISRFGKLNHHLTWHKNTTAKGDNQ